VTLELDAKLAATVRQLLATAGLDKLPPRSEAKPVALGGAEAKPPAQAASTPVPEARVSALPLGPGVQSAAIVPERPAGPSLQFHTKPIRHVA
jgi:hypothetical protein